MHRPQGGVKGCFFYTVFSCDRKALILYIPFIVFFELLFLCKNGIFGKLKGDASFASPRNFYKTKPRTDRRKDLISYLHMQVGYHLFALYVHWQFQREKEAYMPQKE